MTQAQILSLFAAVAADPRFPIALGIGVLAGVVRGFSGFGSALIYIPLVSAVYGPHVAAPTLMLIDTICAMPFAIRAMPQCNWREVIPVSIAAAVTIPLGVWVLVVVDALILRWVIAGLVVVALVALVSGWRYRGRPTVAASLGAGALAGIGGGAAQIGAPPLLVFWLGGDNSAVTVRANIMVYFITQGALTCVMYIVTGLIDAQTIVLSVLMGPPFAVAMWAGAHWFHGSSEVTYRRAAYIIIALAAMVSLPLFDGLR